MKYFGAHVSAAGGVSNAPPNAAAIGADTFALFTANQRRWKNGPLDRAEIVLFKKNMKKEGLDPAFVVPHDSYLINLCSPDSEKRDRSIETLQEETKRVESLGLKYVNLHPGSHLGAFEEDVALKMIAESLDRVVADSEDVQLLLENTAGQGTSLGYTLEHLAAVIGYSSYPDRLGVCVDTCHAFAAGYNIGTEAGFYHFWERFDAVIGLKRLKAMHLNDSKKTIGSRVDRHASLGKGFIGIGCFRLIAGENIFEEIPLILETPDPLIWKDEITFLKETANG